MVSVVIPIYNASAHLSLLLKKLREQTLIHELILIDSESDQATQEIINQENVNVVRIKKGEFNHGTTRNLGLSLASHNTVIFMTQDALPASPTALQQLVKALYEQQDVAMAYGRQLPYPGASTFGRFARLINYPEYSLVKNKSMIPFMGIKTCSCSNSFAAYKKADLLDIGGFPTNTILGEDVSVAARFILNGRSLSYCAEATVFHSHDYTIIDEFRRYFDIGVFHDEQKEVLNEFMQAESEGFKYVLEEWKYLRHTGSLLIVPVQLIRTIAKYLGYRLGNYQQYLPLFFKRKISMHRSFWK